MNVGSIGRITVLFLCAIAIMLVLLGWVSLKQSAKHSDLELDSTVEQINGVTYFNGKTPIQFLDTLRLNGTNGECLSDTVCSLTIENAPEGWITVEDVKELIELVRSDEPARPVCSFVSSYIPFGMLSTIGNESMFLIEGYRRGSYPAELCSVKFFEGNSDEYESWFDNQEL